MYRVTCKQCGASGITDNGHQLQNAVSCRCCTQDHDHDESANACPEAGIEGVRHGGADCTLGDRACIVLTPEAEECPGGHCGPGVDGCTVCRPLLVQWLGIAPVNQVAG